MSLGWRVLDPSTPAERALWIEHWTRSPMQLPFAHPGYGELVARGGRLLAAVFEGPPGNVLYPLVLREIDGTDLVDLISPYGYGGPLVWDASDRDSLARRFWADFDLWASAHRVVSEVVRLSLCDDVLPGPARVQPRLVNYVHVLPVSTEALWDAFAPKVRQNARKAVRSGLTVRIDETGEMLSDFLDLYSTTMVRRASDDWYRFGSDFFDRLHAALPGRFAYVYAMQEEQPVSADLVLLGARTAYYFLGGTDTRAYPLRPNELVKVASMEFACERGCSEFVLGGGVANGDGLERYKRGFAPDGARMFCTAERIHDAAAYTELSGGLSWEETAGGFFPHYRRPMERALT